MYKKFSFASQMHDDIDILRLAGYLEDTGGSELKEHVDAQLEAGITAFAFDFSSSSLISSPGVAALLDISGVIVDDYAGEVVVWGLDKHHSTVLEMSGFFFLVEQAENEQEAITRLKENQ